MLTSLLKNTTIRKTTATAILTTAGLLAPNYFVDETHRENPYFYLFNFLGVPLATFYASSSIYRREKLKIIQEDYGKLVELLDGSDIGVFKLDLQGNFLYANKVIRNKLEYLDEEDGERKLLRSEDYYQDPMQRKELIKMLIRGQEVKDIIIPMINPKTGEEFYTKVRRVNLVGKILYGFLEDVTEEIRLEEHLKNRANTDQLTGCFNRSYLFSELERRIQNDVDHSFTIFFLDLNKFKYVNDTYGHTGGDETLKIVAKRLQSITRNDDIIVRYGGDEFIIIYNTQKDFEEKAKNILRSIKNPITLREQKEEIPQINISTSIGISLYPQHGRDPKKLVGHADAAMYIAKRDKLEYHIYKQNDETENNIVTFPPRNNDSTSV